MHRDFARPQLLAGLLALVLALSGCSGSSSDDAGSKPTTAVADSGEGDEAVADESTPDASPTPQARQQAESCDWSSAALPRSIPSSIPTAAGADIGSALVGAWQHTHFDSGSGYVALKDEDIRFVFPSSGRLLYCQHVPGATQRAERSTDVALKDNAIVIAGAPGYVVSAWNDQTMVWINRADNSRYLLQRR